MKLERFTVLLPEKLLTMLRQEALTEDRSVSSMCRKILEQYFQKRAA